jgi:phosphohistidine phosphatase
VELYLMQHGEALAEEVHPDRPLTDRGREEVEHVARGAASRGVTVSAVLHSGKRRAAETAAILASYLAAGIEPEKTPGLAPKDDPRAAAETIVAREGPIAVVGHMPHLSRLVSLLVAGDPDREIVAFRQGGLVKLTRETRWRVAWILVPELVG